jgi:hypothetical protein
MQILFQVFYEQHVYYGFITVNINIQVGQGMLPIFNNNQAVP